MTRSLCTTTGATRSLVTVIAVMVCGALVLSACGASLPPGSLMHSINTRPQPSVSRFTIAVRPPRDLRPTVERKGESPRVSAFIFLGVFGYLKRRGNQVTDDRLVSPDLPREVHQLAINYLHHSRAFRRILIAPSGGKKGPRADFELEFDVRHLYGTQYRAVSVMAAGSKDSAAASASTATLGVIGNAQLHLRLYDRRGPKPVLISERVILGTATAAPGKATVGTIAKAATKDAFRKLTVYVTDTIARYAPEAPARGGSAAELGLSLAAGRLFFVVQRVSENRKLTERLVIDASSARVVAHRIVPTRGLGYGAPQDWLLSRTRPNGSTMPYAEYRGLAQVLSGTYDLRRVDDLRHFHFFGKKAEGRSAAEEPRIWSRRRPRVRVPESKTSERSE